MPGRLEIRRWLEVHHPVYSVAQSGDGQYVAVGTENGMAVFNLGGHRVAVYPTDEREFPVHQLRVPLDFTRLALATRMGDILTFDLVPEKSCFDLNPHNLHHAIDGIYALDYVQERIALGHYAFALTMLNLEGEVVWQQQNRGEAARGSNWSVGLTSDASTLYTGSVNSGANWLLALDAGNGMAVRRRECDAPLTAVAALANNAGVAALSPGEYGAARLIAYSADLANVLWEQDLDGPATALVADTNEPLVAVGNSYEGIVSLFDVTTGALLASESLRVMINSLSLVQGCYIAAATQDHTVALLRYLP